LAVRPAEQRNAESSLDEERGLIVSQEFLRRYFEESTEVARRLDLGLLNQIVERLVRLRQEGGRLFLCGVGGSAGNCSHAVNDFRKLAGIEAYAPTDNVSELTARTNDEGWETVFSEWLKVSKANQRDALFVLSVGGGSREKGISANLVAAVDEAKGRGIDVLGIVGRDGGYTKKHGDLVLVIPTAHPERVTPHTEAFQAVVWHAIVSDPRLAVRGNKWETASSTEEIRA
jgi:D-sedoheptulose 7-phosphate isomerase